ncbi:hypothetical protein ACRAWF_12140 [Streptomyces sp. L7]
MITGYVLGESLRPGAVFAPHGLRIRKVERVDNSASATAGHPDAWTFIECETADDSAAEPIAESLAAALEPANGWYADFTVREERVVVFAGKVFRYRRGDETGRAEAIAYGRSVGTPEHQLDWEE